MIKYNDKLFLTQLESGELSIDSNILSKINCDRIEDCDGCAFMSEDSLCAFINCGSEELYQWKEFLSQRYPEEFV